MLRIIQQASNGGSEGKPWFPYILQSHIKSMLFSDRLETDYQNQLSSFEMPLSALTIKFSGFVDQKELLVMLNTLLFKILGGQGGLA